MHKNDNDKSNNKKKIIVISTTLVAVIIIGVTVAYFMSRSVSDEHTIASGNLSITYANENTFNLTSLIPLTEDEIQDKAAKIEFTVTNNGNLKAYVEIGMTGIIIPEEFKNQDFMYALYNEDNNIISKGNFSWIGTDTELIMTKNLELEVGDSKRYTAYIWINETPEDQTAMMNKNFKAKMQITGYLKSTEYKDDSGANTPVLASGMIPVIYDATSDVWKVADIEKEWYNYDEQWWANAVTTSDASYRTSPAGTEIPMEDINSMWVWIPRYKYRIPSNIGSSSNVASPPEIDVVFESGTETTGSSLALCPITSTSCYYTHPAFRDGSSVYKTTAYDQGGWDKELEGIWVGKFETGGTSTTPTIKPDVLSLRNQTIYNQFVTSLKFAGGTKSGSTVSFSGNSTYGLTSSTDTHMMKNTEWGAVAYLSQSKYGKMGNPNYSGANKEIYKNNSSSYYTGRSSGVPPASGCSSYGTYSYIGKTCSSATCTGSQNILSGTGASTTGTVYGIYDMVGGTIEYTMGILKGIVWTSEYPTNILPENKYYDKYSTTDNRNVTSAKAIKGDATYETMSWYSDIARFIYNQNPWFIRGGAYYSTSDAGIFFSYVNYVSYSYYGFHNVLIP